MDEVSFPRCGVLTWAEVAHMCSAQNDLLFGGGMSKEEAEAWFGWIKAHVLPRYNSADIEGRIGEDLMFQINMAAMATAYRRAEEVTKTVVMPKRTRFIMRRQTDVRFDGDIASHVMLAVPYPVEWIRASRNEEGRFVYLDDHREVEVDSSVLTRESYGVRWAVSEACMRKPPFLPPERCEEGNHWAAYCPGVQGWVICKRERGKWLQRCGIELEDVKGQRYGDDYGKIVPPAKSKAGSYKGVCDRFVRHPVYTSEWIEAFEEDGNYRLRSFPSDVMIDTKFTNSSYGTEWRWPPV